MIRLLRADLIRLGRSFSFRLSLMAMLGLSAAFMTMQATAMDYTVPLSRVIFLPMSMYGITIAAFVSVFVGTDFSDGFIRNKLLTAEHRYNLVVAQIIVSCLACLIVYTTVTVFTAVIGRFFFENNVDLVKLLRFYGIGAGMCCAFVSFQLGGYGNQVLMQFPNCLQFYGGLTIVYVLPFFESEWIEYENKQLAKEAEKKRLKLEKKRALRV